MHDISYFVLFYLIMYSFFVEFVVFFVCVVFLAFVIFVAFVVFVVFVLLGYIYIHTHVNSIEFKLPTNRHFYFCFILPAAILLSRLDHESGTVIYYSENRFSIFQIKFAVDLLLTVIAYNWIYSQNKLDFHRKFHRINLQSVLLKFSL